MRQTWSACEEGAACCRIIVPASLLASARDSVNRGMEDGDWTGTGIDLLLLLQQKERRSGRRGGLCRAIAKTNDHHENSTLHSHLHSPLLSSPLPSPLPSQTVLLSHWVVETPHLHLLSTRWRERLKIIPPSADIIGWPLELWGAGVAPGPALRGETGEMRHG